MDQELPGFLEAQSGRYARSRGQAGNRRQESQTVAFPLRFNQILRAALALREPLDFQLGWVGNPWRAVSITSRSNGPPVAEAYFTNTYGSSAALRTATRTPPLFTSFFPTAARSGTILPLTHGGSHAAAIHDCRFAGPQRLHGPRSSPACLCDSRRRAPPSQRAPRRRFSSLLSLRL